MTLRRPVWALHVLIVGLALHNLVMALLWRAGVRGAALTVVAAWKDVLLVAALALVVAARRGLPFKASSSDWLALAFGAIVVLYGVLPQSWLGGGATHKGVLYAARHDLLPVGAYFLGRGLDLTEEERSRLCRTMLTVAAGVAAYGLVDVYLVPLSWWRASSGWFSDQLGLTYNGLSGLPENFVYNAGNGVVFRRLTSTFLSPLATAYLLVVAMFFIPIRRRWGPPLALLLFAALLWTHTRSALLALVVGLLVLAAVRRRLLPLGLALAVAVLGFAFVKGYDHVGPAHALHAGRADGPEPDREGAPRRIARPDERERVVGARAPREPARGSAHCRAPSVGLRPRQRGRHRRSHACQGEGR